MRFILSLLVVVGATVSASPVFDGDCNSGTMAEYIALGSTGCKAFGYTWSNFQFTASVDGVSMDPAEMTVTFEDQVVGYRFVGLASWQADPGVYYAALMSFTVSGGPIFKLAAANNANFNPGTITTTGSNFRDGCLNGVYAPDCTGTALPPVSDYAFDPAETFASFRTNDSFVGDAGIGSVQTNGFIGIIDPTPDGIPEPQTWILCGTGMCLLLLSSARNLRSSR